MQKTPKVSIITVVYNGIEHVEETIKSVLEQTYDNVEYIIIDGGSNDGTVELIRKYEEQIDYWISEPDNGIYDAMNKGLAQATGETVGLINADDWYERDAVEKVVRRFQNSNADVLHGSMRILKENGSEMIVQAEENLERLKKGMLLNHPTVFAKRSQYAKYGFFDTSYSIVADWEMMLRWWHQDAQFEALDDVLANFRMGGVSSEHLKKSFLEKHRVRKKHNITGIVDWYYVYDRLKSVLPADKLLNISLYRQKQIGK